jgi:hypothetical protein
MQTVPFTSTLVRGDHVRSFHLQPAPTGGWEVSERVDQRLVYHQRHTDWQHVELTLTRFANVITWLKAQGWREA